MPMNEIGTDRPRERSGYPDPVFDENGHFDGTWDHSHWNDMTDEPGTDGPVGKAYLKLHNENNLAAKRLGKEMPSGIWTTGKNRNERPDVSNIIEEQKTTFRESVSGINSRMSAWHQANQHPQMASKFLKAVFDDDETDAAVVDAAAEEGPDDFEAPGIAHMKDTKKERNEAIQPVVQTQDKTWGAFLTGHNSKFSPHGVTPMDVNVDTASYLEDLMSKGLITEEQYKEARQAFDDGSQEHIYFPSL